jgi:hypothetical protein
MSDQVKEPIVIDLPQSEETDTGFDTEGLIPQEIQLAEKHGLIDNEEKKVEDEHKEQPEPTTEKDTGTEEKEETKEKQEEVVKHPEYEDVEKDENLLKHYNKNEQALYWGKKGEIKKRQRIQKEFEEFKADAELRQVKDRAYIEKIKKLDELLSGNQDDITIEAIRSVIGPKNAVAIEEAQQPKADPSEKERQFIQARAEKLKIAEKIGMARYPKFKEMADLAKEVIISDKSETYKRLIDSDYNNPDTDEETFVERVVSIARINPKFNELEKSVEKPKAKVEDFKKKTSSASISSGGGHRTVSEDDMTPDDAINLTTAQWKGLSEKTKKRLLMG